VVGGGGRLGFPFTPSPFPSSFCSRVSRRARIIVFRELAMTDFLASAPRDPFFPESGRTLPLPELGWADRKYAHCGACDLGSFTLIPVFG